MRLSICLVLSWLIVRAVSAQEALTATAVAEPPPASYSLHSWHEALQQVRARSPEYLGALDNLLRADAATRIALAALFPSVDAQASINHQFITSPQSIDDRVVDYPLQNVWNVSSTLSWNIGDLHAYHALGSAKLAQRAVESDLAEQRRSIAKTLLNAMLGTLAAERVATLNRSGLRAALERLALAEQHKQYGHGTVLDVARAKQDVERARAPIVTGDEALRQSREVLGLALGSNTPTSAPGDLALTDFERAVAATCQVHATIDQRPDIVAARLRVELATRAIDDAWLRFAPTLGVQSQLAYNSQVLYGPHPAWNVRVVLSLPLWEGGARYGQLQDTRAAADQARQGLTQLRLAALLERTQANRAVTVSTEALAIADKQRSLADEVDRYTREGYQHGLGTSLDLVTSAEALRQSEVNLALSQFRVAQARVLSVLANADCVL